MKTSSNSDQVYKDACNAAAKIVNSPTFSKTCEEV